MVKQFSGEFILVRERFLFESEPIFFFRIKREGEEEGYSFNVVNYLSRPQSSNLT